MARTVRIAPPRKKIENVNPVTAIGVVLVVVATLAILSACVVSSIHEGRGTRPARYVTPVSTSAPGDYINPIEVIPAHEGD